MKGNIAADLEFINKALNSPKSLQLIFRASEHQFKASEFHRLCDNTEDTFVLLRTEFNKTIGGYTHYKWNQVPHNSYVNDAGKRAFLLQVDLREKMTPITQEHLIKHLTDYGPIFGGGFDLYISNLCNANSNSGCYLGDTYNHEGTNKYVHNNQATDTAMSGNPDGHNFRVVEY
jgi:hypothetical protein